MRKKALRLKTIEQNEAKRLNEAGIECPLAILHEPLLALNIESDIEGGVDKILKTLNSFFSTYDSLNM